MGFDPGQFVLRPFILLSYLTYGENGEGENFVIVLQGLKDTGSHSVLNGWISP